MSAADSAPAGDAQSSFVPDSIEIHGPAWPGPAQPSEEARVRATAAEIGRLR
jgi:hypothetical protein